MREELERSDAGIAVDFAFETHEHSRFFESRYSGADLGIVVVVNHPILGHSRRALLLQAKRLFQQRRSREFSLFSSYESFDQKQAAFLKDLAARFGAYSSVFYLGLCGSWEVPCGAEERRAYGRLAKSGRGAA